jgi:hypothetical protein
MLLVAHILEFYYLIRHYFLSFSPLIASWVPSIGSDLINLQPSLFALVMVHLIFDDSRARLAPEKGGLGYRGAWTTLEGLYKTAIEHKNTPSPSSDRHKISGGISLGFNRAKRALKLPPKSTTALVSKVVKVVATRKQVSKTPSH